MPQICLMPSVRSVPCSSQAFPSTYKWTQTFQGRLCYLWKQLVNSEGFSPGIQHRKINHRGKNPTHTEKRGLGRWIHCSHSVVWGWFLGLFTVGRRHCPPGAWAPSVRQRQWHKSSTGVTAEPVASAQSRTSGRSCCANSHRGFHKTRTGLPRAASPVPPHPVVKFQQRGCDSIQAAYNKGYWMSDEPAALQHHYTLRFALAADFHLSLFLVTDRQGI